MWLDAMFGSLTSSSPNRSAVGLGLCDHEHEKLEQYQNVAEINNTVRLESAFLLKHPCPLSIENLTTGRGKSSVPQFVLLPACGESDSQAITWLMPHNMRVSEQGGLEGL
jgi:hypothetical protein